MIDWLNSGMTAEAGAANHPLSSPAERPGEVVGIRLRRRR
jgi:hypothetical protein